MSFTADVHCHWCNRSTKVKNWGGKVTGRIPLDELLPDSWSSVHKANSNVMHVCPTCMEKMIAAVKRKPTDPC